MKKTILVSMGILLACSMSQADWNEGDPNKMHYPQLPKVGGWDVAMPSQWPERMADDWQCSQTGFVSDIHFWVSWEANDVQPITGFTIRIWSDDPCGPNGWPEPNKQLWQQDFSAGNFTVRDMNDDLQGWFDSTVPEWNQNDHTKWAQVNITNISRPFIQQEGKVYWLIIDVWSGGNIGWKESGSPHFRASAVYYDGADWNELSDPLTQDPLDFAFVINGPSLVKPLASHTKWSQPPVEIDPNSNIPIYCGWDELSYKSVLETYGKITADDFRCLGNMPVTSIRWWGSYYGWEWSSSHGILPPQLPDGWWIGFWSNVPANAPPLYLPFSYPGEVLHGFIIPADRVTFNEAGYDDYYGYYPEDICYQYDVELEPNEIFWQGDYNDLTEDNIYWISIVAMYQSDLYPQYIWGWKTRSWNWLDDAVTFQTTDAPDVGFKTEPNAVSPIEDPCMVTGFDVSFELDTDPNYIKWEQLYTGIRDWPHYEDVNSTLDTTDEENEVVVFDDWRCLKRTPVTAIVWWGSYIGYGYEAGSYGPFMPLPNRPDRFRLGISTNVQAGADPCYAFSHPGQVIWAYEITEYDEVFVGYDKHPDGEPNEPVFRYSVKLPEDMWFRQPDYNEVFWLGIQAVYDSNQLNYSWGWTNHKHVFNNDAVQGYWDSAEWKWKEVQDQTDTSADMSFLMFTDPNECSGCANYDLVDGVDFFDFAEFANQWYWSGPPGGYNNGDLNCNGIVDLYDLDIFVQQWLQYCP